MADPIICTSCQHLVAERSCTKPTCTPQQCYPEWEAKFDGPCNIPVDTFKAALAEMHEQRRLYFSKSIQLAEKERQEVLYKEFLTTVNSGIDFLEELIGDGINPHSLYIATLKDIRRACGKINQYLDKSS